MASFILAHGWGMSANFWQNLAPLLKGRVVILDRGYFGAPQPLPSSLPDDEYIGIGHSLGFATLVQNKQIPWRALVSIGGFMKFIHRPKQKNVLQQMHAAFLANPSAVLQKFYEANKLPWMQPAAMNLNLLATDLLKLEDIDVSTELPLCPILALHAADDQIVTLASCYEDFREHSISTVTYGGHGLGFHAADLCAQEIHEQLLTQS